MTDATPIAFLTPSDHIGLIALRYNVTRQDILGSSRKPNIMRARQHCYWFFRERGRSYPEIARIMRRKCHTSVLHGVQVHMYRNGIIEHKPLPALAGYSEGVL